MTAISDLWQLHENASKNVLWVRKRKQLIHLKPSMWAVRLCCVCCGVLKKTPAASDPLSPDLQMDQAAQSSRSYKISLAWRYNSFSLYVSCQINLASSGAILVLVT